MVTAKESRAIARQMIRENRRLLLGSYLAFFGVTLAAVLVQFLFMANTMATALFGFASLFLLIPLTLGILHIHNMIYYRRRCSVGNLFDFYRNYSVALKALGVSYLFSMILSAILTPVLMIAVLPLMLSAPVMGGYVPSALLLVGIGVVFFVSIAIALLAESFIMACYFILLRNRSIGFGRLLTGALKIGGRCILRYLLLQLSFFGWGLLCSLPLVGALMFAPVLQYSQQALGLPLLIIGLGSLLFGLAVFTLTIYINAASTVFFNVAIDEYEQQYPDFANAAPPVPHTPGPQGPADRYAGFSQPGLPKQQEEPAPPVHTGDEAEPAIGEEAPSEEAAAPEWVQAEIVEPQDGLHDVILISPGVGKMLVSMIICELTGMEHEQARHLVENAPKPVCTGIPLEEAHEVAKRLTEAGARVEIR